MWVKATDPAGKAVWINMDLVRMMTRVTDAAGPGQQAKTIIVFDDRDRCAVQEQPEDMMIAALEAHRRMTRAAKSLRLADLDIR